MDSQADPSDDDAAVRPGAADPRHHVVVIGAGFGGLQLVQRLKGAGTRITLIDQRNHHLFQPLLYQVATTILSASEIAWPIRNIFRDRPDVTTLLARVCGIDVANRYVDFDDGACLGYDTLVVATGAGHAYFGHDEWEPFAPGLKTLEDASMIRRRLLLAFEHAERETDPDARRALLTFGVIGAGPTGVELAGIIAELANKTLPPDFREIDTRQTRVMLIEAGPRVLSTFPEALSDYAADALLRRGVELRLGQSVTDCNAEGLRIGEEFIPCRTCVWAAGVAASPAAKWLGVTGDRAGRVQVQPDLTLEGHPEIFVIGDTAAVKTAAGHLVPGIAPAAKQQGDHAGRAIRSRLEGKAGPGIFRYRNQGNLATIGKSAAVVDWGRLRLRGSPAWWVWGIAHIFFLIGTKSRAAVVLSWLSTYLTGQHSARLITEISPDARPK